MKIEIEVSEENEGTAEPWWVIVDPKQMMKPDPYSVMIGMVSGPYFSRKEATDHLKARRHNYTDKAVVYCASGYDSIQYKKAYREAESKARLPQPTPPRDAYDLAEMIVEKVKAGTWTTPAVADAIQKYVESIK